MRLAAKGGGGRAASDREKREKEAGPDREVHGQAAAVLKRRGAAFAEQRNLEALLPYVRPLFSSLYRARLTEARLSVVVLVCSTSSCTKQHEASTSTSSAMPGRASKSHSRRSFCTC